MVHRAATLAGLALVLSCGTAVVRADDSSDSGSATSTAPAADPLAQARKLIAGQRWPQALAELRRVNAGRSADWNNLMGYALRKQAHPDLEGAQRYYDTALRIDPKHQGALEYSGELALMKGDLPTAEARRRTLAGLCHSPCEPLQDLDQAIASYKANGNHWKAGGGGRW